MHRSLGDTRGLLLFIDQLEEMVTIADPTQSRIVGEALGHLCARIPSVRMLMTVRSDFLARVAAVGGLGDELVRALYILRPLTPDKIQEAIIGPAQMKGVSFESPELVETLVASTAKTDGGLPLLQFALTELWEARRGDSITKAALDAIGGVAGALARHADQVMLALPVDQRKEARRILMALVTMEGTRARRSDEEIARSPAARQALEALVRARLVVARDTGDGAAYEVAHEALLKGWDALRKWLEEHSERRAAKQRLETAAAEWSRLGESREALWSKLQLSDAELLEDADITPRQAEFLAASRRNQWRKKQLRRSLAVLVPSLLVAMYGGYRIKLSRDLSHRVEAHMRDGQQLRAQAKRLNNEVNELRKKSLAEFDSQKVDDGEKDWARVLELSQDLDDLYGRAGQSFEASVTLDGSRSDARNELGDVLLDRSLLAEKEQSRAKLRDLTSRMELYDLDHSRRKLWDAPGVVSVVSNPPGAQAKIARYQEDKQRHMVLTAERELGPTPLSQLSLAQGSYLLTFTAPGRTSVRYPIIVGRAEHLNLTVPLPLAADVPPGFVYIPPGRFLFGASGDESVRRGFLGTSPSHQVVTSGYLIAKHETTFADWLDYIRASSAEGREHAMLTVTKGGFGGSVSLQQLPDGRWQLAIQPGSYSFTVPEGTPLIYAGRKRNRIVNWLNAPASGMDREEAVAYLKWLDRTGRLKGARLCTEFEWERAARGADDREYPHGNSLTGDDANIDETYEKDAKLFGPDEVGMHPTSRSPFGLDDMAGNVYEWVTSSLEPNQAVIRSGGYFFAPLVCRSSNRGLLASNFKDPNLGLRVCAPEPAVR